MFNPVATYRLQFHKDFTLNDLEKIYGYLNELGIKTIYASPVFEATPGSTHGYDSVNPLTINPEIGTLEQLKSIKTRLNELDIHWLQDIVPNHMAFHPNNIWLMDVLEKGPLSVYKDFFDISLSNDLLQGRIMVPFLAASIDDVIEKGELKVSWENQRLGFKYFDSFWPLNIHSYEIILKSGTGLLDEAIVQLLAEIPFIHKIDDPRAFTFAMDEFRMQLGSLAHNEEFNHYLISCIQNTNNRKDILKQLADHQIYRLCHWQETDKTINFRRFFTINGLICLNIQKTEVFQKFHEQIKSLINEKVFDGLRIDHIDGLYDPSEYLNRLSELTEDKIYTVVEKILEPGEELPLSWPVQGNTGYDYLSLVNNLLTNAESKKNFTAFYNELTGNNTPVHQQILDKKRHILYNHMSGELDNLYRLFIESGLADEKALKKIHRPDLKHAIGEFLINCPVYRYYGNRFPLSKEESLELGGIFESIRKNETKLVSAIGLLESALLQKPLKKDRAFNTRALRFYQSCMQFTGPLMAKGVEDTLMYSYNRFIAHNEVGDTPDAFGIFIKDFHQKMEYRQENWPLSLNATSTHDTKRGEDVRARLNVLSDLPDQWFELVKEWKQANQEIKRENTPDANDEYFIYQTLLGTYPMPGEAEDDCSTRMQEYLQKALREAKKHSNWTSPNEEYERGVMSFTRNLFDTSKPFWHSFKFFHEKIADYGIINSLAQVVLKFTCPGVPDVYQGCELWDLSLVDPDNRRPVNYDLRELWLKELALNAPDTAEKLLSNLWRDRHNGKIKLWLVHRLLKIREQHPELFEKGEYIPLQVKGRYKKHVLAFARRYQQTWYVIAIPLHIAGLCEQAEIKFSEFDWRNTRIVLPPEAPASAENILLQASFKTEDSISLSTLFKSFPLALIKLQQVKNERSAGILMPVSSLPSAFGTGDFGPEAKKFAEFLSRSCQKYWQILPLNPTELANGHSPYSSFSSMAGNTLLISPELLVSEGLLDNSLLKDQQLPVADRADYRHAEQLKTKLFDEAWKNFQKGGFAALSREFDEFCEKESYWLEDFALFVVLKKTQAGNSWQAWPKKYKLRDTEALREFANTHGESLKKVKWLQYLFSKQWQDLKNYCNGRGINILGDLPFYVSIDSVDVWSHPEIFSLDENLSVEGVAGVPPDYFNENGQLWGMPVFRWDKLREQNYAWWIRRIKKNMEMYDLLRLDHFRAFSSYWEVAAGEDTAINGRWKPGPADDFFLTVRKELGKLPFLAEDLGDIDEPVNELRKKFQLPGMKVMQFAFGDEMPESIYIPHNYAPDFFVYSGTHDNNTTAGWFRQEASRDIREQIEQYTGLKVTKKNVHTIIARLAYASVAKAVILPVQDVCGLDENSRMNTPASVEGNWLWRLLPGQLNKSHEKQLRTWTRLYNRV